MNDPQKKYRLETVSKNNLLEGLNQFQGAISVAWAVLTTSDSIVKIWPINIYLKSSHVTLAALRSKVILLLMLINYLLLL